MKKIPTKDEDLTAVQENAAEALRPLERSEIVQGLLLEDVDLTAGLVKSVDHKLGRRLRGYIVVRQDAQAQIWESNSKFPFRFLNLNTSADVRVSLWVF